MQVTGSEARLVSCASSELLFTWKPEGDSRITVVAGNYTQLLVALAGGRLVYLEVEGRELKQGATQDMGFEVACIDVTPIPGPTSVRDGLSNWRDAQHFVACCDDC